MKKEQITRLLEHWRRPVHASEIFKFTLVLVHSKTDETREALYTNSFAPQQETHPVTTPHSVSSPHAIIDPALRQGLSSDIFPPSPTDRVQNSMDPNIDPALQNPTYTHPSGVPIPNRSHAPQYPTYNFPPVPHPTHPLPNNIDPALKFPTFSFPFGVSTPDVPTLDDPTLLSVPSGPTFSFPFGVSTPDVPTLDDPTLLSFPSGAPTTVHDPTLLSFQSGALSIVRDPTMLSFPSGAPTTFHQPGIDLCTVGSTAEPGPSYPSPQARSRPQPRPKKKSKNLILSSDDHHTQEEQLGRPKRVQKRKTDLYLEAEEKIELAKKNTQKRKK
jgi:hypothetical protein